MVVWLVRIWTYNNAGEKNIVFHGKRKRTNANKKRILSESTFSQSELRLSHLRFPLARRKTWWIKNGSGLLIPSIVQMTIHFQYKKIKLHWFNLKKFISKKSKT